MDSFFQILPFDINSVIFSYMSVPGIFALYQDSLFFNQLKSNNKFWDSYYFNRFGHKLDLSIYDPKHVENLSTCKDFILFINNQYQHLMNIKYHYRGIKLMARYGFEKEMNEFISKNKIEQSILRDKATKTITEGNSNRKRILLRGVEEEYSSILPYYYDNAIIEAARYGHRKIFEILLQRIYKFHSLLYDIDACYFRYRSDEMVLYRMTEWYGIDVAKGYLKMNNNFGFQLILTRSIKHVNFDIFKLVSSECTRRLPKLCDSPEMFEVLIENSDDIRKNPSDIRFLSSFYDNLYTKSAVKNGDKEIVGSTLTKITNHVEIIKIAAECGRVDIINMVLDYLNR